MSLTGSQIGAKIKLINLEFFFVIRRHFPVGTFSLNLSQGVSNDKLKLKCS